PERTARVVASRAIDSRRLVSPCALSPVITSAPGPRSTSRRRKVRTLVSSRRGRYRRPRSYRTPARTGAAAASRERPQPALGARRLERQAGLGAPRRTLVAHRLGARLAVPHRIRLGRRGLECHKVTRQLVAVARTPPEAGQIVTPGLLRHVGV